MPNARLISKAPELFHALRALVENLEDTDGDRNPETGEIHQDIIEAKEILAQCGDQ